MQFMFQTNKLTAVQVKMKKKNFILISLYSGLNIDYTLFLTKGVYLGIMEMIAKKNVAVIV